MSLMKSQADIETLKHSSKILMSCFKLLENELKAGVSAGYLDKLATTFIRDHGGEPSFLNYNGFKYAVCTSINNEVVHGISPDSKIIPDNCIVSLDLGVNYKGLFSDSAKTYVVGEVAPEALNLLEVTKKALVAGIGAVKAGNRVGDVGAACERVISKAGLGNVLDLGGHGVGYKVHDEPFIPHSGKEGKGPRFFENQVIAIEPMVTLGSPDVEFDETPQDNWTVRTADKKWSAHFEHTILITKKGCEVLTDIPDGDLLK